VGSARARKIPARLIEDEDYQLRYERVAGIDVAKADVCTRLPAAAEGARRASRLEEVPATAREILALAGRLLADGVELVVIEATSDYVRCEGAWVQVGGACGRFGLGRRRSTRASAQWPVSALACAAGNCGVRSPG
jgi:hypothetical protein